MCVTLCALNLNGGGLCGLLLGAVLIGGCTAGQDYVQAQGATMGTYYRVSARCPDAEQPFLHSRIESELVEVNDQMSTYQADSELSRFNRSAPGSWFPVSVDLVRVIEAAGQISERSGGAFDVTVAPLVNLWGFGPEGRITQAPDAQALADALAQVGYGWLEVVQAPPALRKIRPLHVDLSAIAKGHGVDRLAEVLAGAGCLDYLIDVGGEVRGMGVNPTGNAWRIGVEVPDPEVIGGVQRVLILQDRSVATSGDYRNFLNLAGGRVSHTLDPSTGRPVEHALASVTVVHESAMWADGLATALNVLGPQAGFALAEEQELAALFLIRRASGFEERYTSAMLNFLDDAR